MASSVSSGQADRPDGSISSKLFNSGHPLGSFLDTDTSGAERSQPAIDLEEDVDERRGASGSVLLRGVVDEAPEATARSPRDGIDRSARMAHEGTIYPPTSGDAFSKPVLQNHERSQDIPINGQSKHDPSSTADTSNSSSEHSSFDKKRGVSASQVDCPTSPTNSFNVYLNGRKAINSENRAEQFPNQNSHHLHTTTAGNENNGSGFTKVGARRKSIQVFGTPPVGIIGLHKPREVIRIDRDYTSGEICQFWSGYPVELQGRVTATQHLNVMNELNALLASAFDPYKSILDNVIAVLSLYISTWLLSSHYDKIIAKFDQKLEEANRTIYNPAGLNLVNPRKNGYLFLELEYY